MGSSGKGSSGGYKSYDYFGTVAGAICWGPAHTLQAVIVDGKEIVTGPVTLSTAATNLTLNPDADDYLDSGGRLTVYRGDQTTADAALTGHPPYTGLCYIVCVGLLFGRERTAAPNVQVIISRLPQISTSISPALANVFTDLDGSSKPTVASQCNPVAALAEILTSRHGLGMPEAALDATSWDAASLWAAEAGHIAYAFCSPSFTTQESARSVIRSLLEMVDATLYWSSTGKLAIALMEPGVTPGGVLTIDSRHITERHRLEAPGLADVPTSTLAKYSDRAREWKQREQKADNLVALGLRSGVPQVQSIDRPHITGADQAALHAAEATVRASRPIGSVEVTVRKPIVSALYPGAKVLVDIDPEPGGSGLAQLCVVEEIEEDAGDRVRLSLRPDTMQAATLYSPQWTADTPQDNSCPPVDAAKALAIPLPTEFAGGPAVGILATRPRVDVVGFRVYYSPDDVDYADLGSQPGFAVRAGVGAGIDSDDTEIILTLTDGDTGPDAYLAGRYPTTDAGAQADELLLVLANVSAGRVVITSGEPEIEVCSIETRALVGSDMTYTIARARLGTQPRAWTTGAKAYILPRASLIAWTHPGISSQLTTGAAGYLHLVAYTAEDTDDTSPIPEITFLMPSNADPRPLITWTTPAASVGTTDGSGSYTPAFTVTDLQGDLVAVRVTSEDVSGNQTLWANFSVIPARSWAYPGDAIKLPTVGVHRLTVTATDALGSVASSTRTIERIAPSGGDAIPAPRFSVASGTRFYGSLTVTIAINSPGNRAEYQLTAPGSASPTSPLSIVSTSFPQVLRASHRLWVRAGDGTNWGGWVFADYRREG